MPIGGEESGASGRHRRLRRLPLRKVVFAHVVPLAVSARRVGFGASRCQATGAPIGTFALGRQPPVPPHLLVVPEAVPLRHLSAVASADGTVGPTGLILTLRGESAVSADLLVVTRAVSAGPGLLVTSRGSTYDSTRLHSSDLQLAPAGETAMLGSWGQKQIGCHPYLPRTSPRSARP